VAVSKPTNIQPTTNLVGRIHFPKLQNSHEAKTVLCHHPNKKMVAGPFQKIREDYGEKWCIAYVKNNDSMREAGDIKSIFVFNKWQHMVMPKYTNLSDSQILLILDYVDSFEYVEMNNGLDHYSHRKLSINSMKDSIKAYEEKNGKY
jgi:cytochrome c551/c552